MVAVTLVGEKQAKEGRTFVFLGPLGECRDCKLKTVCFNLEEGRTYTIMAVRNVHHDCKIHESGVRVVEVEKAPIRAAVFTRNALEGTSVVWEQKDCINIGCPNFYLCGPRGIKAGEKYRVVKVLGILDCPDGVPLKEVLLEI
jgi:hypothetical protein